MHQIVEKKHYLYLIHVCESYFTSKLIRPIVLLAEPVEKLKTFNYLVSGVRNTVNPRLSRGIRSKNNPR